MAMTKERLERSRNKPQPVADSMKSGKEHWRGVSVVKRTSRSSRGLEFSSQHACQVAHNHLSLELQGIRCHWPLHAYIHTQLDTHTHNQKYMTSKNDSGGHKPKKGKVASGS